MRLDPQEYINETMMLPDFPAALNELKEKIRNTQMNLTIRNYPKILFLGTGSCIPNKTRNTSGILLQTRYIIIHLYIVNIFSKVLPKFVKTLNIFHFQ